MFSVVIPLYNKELSIQDTISSVIDQTFQNFEIIVVNDGSTDGSAERVRHINDNRIRLYDKINGGVSSARNFGIIKAKYNWIAFLDGDDLWDPNYLMQVNNRINQASEAIVITTAYAKKNRDGAIVNRFIPNIKERTFDYFKLINEFGGNISCSAICVDKKTLLSVGMFNEKLTHGEDSDLWEKLARITKFHFIKEVLSYYILDAENRAMDNRSNIYKTRIYNIDFTNVTNKEEKIYYKRAILKALHRMCRNGDFKRAYILFKKHSNFIKPVNVLGYLFAKISRKLN